MGKDTDTSNSDVQSVSKRTLSSDSDVEIIVIVQFSSLELHYQKKGSLLDNYEIHSIGQRPTLIVPFAAVLDCASSAYRPPTVSKSPKRKETDEVKSEENV